MHLRRIPPTARRTVGLGLALLLLITTTSLGKTRKQSCSLCERDTLQNVVVPANETLLKELKVLAEGVDSTVEILGDGQDYLTQLPETTIKTLSRRGVRVTPWDGPSDDPIEKDGEICQDAIPAETGITYTGQFTNEVYWVWYSFTPSESNTYRIMLAGSEVDAIIEVYDACGGRLIDDAYGMFGIPPALAVSMEAGSTYYIKVESYWYIAGGYSFQIDEAEDVSEQSCQDAFVAEPGVTYEGQTTASATACWYAFTPAASDTYQISLAGSDFDTTLSVYDECGGELIAYNDDAGASLASRVSLEMEAETTYYIQIDGYWGDYGNYVLFIDTYEPVPGETCLYAIEADPNTLYEGTLTDLMWEVWYSFTAPATGDYVISLKGSDFDTVLYVYDRCGGYAVWFNDDTNDLTSRLSMNMYEGQTYYILISPYDTIGSYNLQITPVTEPAPNDTVAAAVPITLADTVEGCTDAATSSLSYSSCGGYDSRDVWHSFTPSSSLFAKLSVVGEDFDTTLSVFDEDSGTELACNDQKDDCTNDSQLSMEMVQGTSYLIRVAGFYDGTGHYSLTLDPAIDSPPAASEAPHPADGAEQVDTDIVLSWDNWTVPAVSQKSRRRNTGDDKPNGRSLQGIYGRDDRLDDYQVTDSDILQAGAATVILFPKDLLTFMGRKRRYLLNDTTTMGEYIALSYGDPMCSDEPFQDQPSPGYCSGFLVAPDLIVTAGHCVGCEGDIQEWVAVFGFRMTDANTASIEFEADDVYSCREQVVGQSGTPDWSIVRLDRPVAGHLPVRIRRREAVAEKQPLMMAGYPVGLPLKYDMGATVKDTWQQSYFSANTDSFGGNSGSAVFNLDTLEVEGILVWGNGDFDYDYNAGCVTSIVCPDSGCPTWEYATRITLLAGAVPCYDVFLGTDPDSLVQVDAGWGAPQFDPRGLEPGQTYYWRIVSRNAAGQTAGPVWSFTTAQ